MDCETLKRMIKELDVDGEKILDDIKMLPDRYVDEFVGDVLVDKVSITSFNKVFSYYVDEIWEELTDDEKIPFEEKFLIIQLK